MSKQKNPLRRRPFRQGVTVQHIAELIHGELRGSGAGIVSGIEPLASAGAGDLTFLAPTGRKRKSAALVETANQTQAAAVIVSNYSDDIQAPQIRVQNPMGAVVMLSQMLAPAPVPPAGVHPTAIVSPSARLGTGVSVGAYAVIGDDVEIGDKTTLHPHVVIYEGARIGSQCIIHAHASIREYVIVGDDCVIQNGVVIGGDGFGYYPDRQVGHARIPHIGTVELGDHVDCGANTTVDRAMLGATRVGASSKIDNLVMVGHNTQIGKRVLLCGKVGVSGSCDIGDDVILGGDVGVADHTVIGPRTKVAARAGITGDLAGDMIMAGHPAIEVTAWRRQSAVLPKLPELMRAFRRLQHQVEELRNVRLNSVPEGEESGITEGAFDLFTSVEVGPERIRHRKHK